MLTKRGRRQVPAPRISVGGEKRQQPGRTSHARGRRFETRRAHASKGPHLRVFLRSERDVPLASKRRERLYRPNYGPKFNELSGNLSPPSTLSFHQMQGSSLHLGLLHGRNRVAHQRVEG